MRIDLDSLPEATIREAAGVIRRGGIVLHPTDTVYGLACDPFHLQAVNRLFGIKGRPREKGFLLLVPELTWVEKLSAEVPQVFYEVAEKFWPGPFTFLLEANATLPAWVQGKEGKVALRHPALPYLESWMKAIPGPLVSTSANRSGEPLCGSVSSLQKRFEQRVDLFLEIGDMACEMPSSVVDLTTTPPRIVRVGRDVEKIKHFLRILR